MRPTIQSTSLKPITAQTHAAPWCAWDFGGLRALGKTAAAVGCTVWRFPASHLPSVLVLCRVHRDPYTHWQEHTTHTHCSPETPNGAFHPKNLLSGEDPWLLPMLLPGTVGMAQRQDPRISVTSSHKWLKDA